MSAANVTLKMFDDDQLTEWRQWRRRGIGGSDIAGLLGWSPWSTPASLYLDKTGQLADRDNVGEAARWGRLLEGAIGNEFEERTGLHVDALQLCVAKVLPSWQRATLDGLVLETPQRRPLHQALTDAVGILEIKNTAAHGWDQIPAEYECQVQWQMGITGITHAWLAALHGGRRLHIYELDYDPAGFAALAKVAERFWVDHVQAENPPPVDAHPATTQALKDAYRHRATDTSVALDNTPAHAAALAWLPTKARLAEIQRGFQLVENVLRDTLGEHTHGTIDGEEVITWKAQNAGGAPTYDLERARADGVNLADYAKPKGVTRVMRPTKTLKGTP